MREDDLPRSLVLRKLHAEFLDIILRAGITLFDLNDRGSLLSESLIRKSDDRDILHRLIAVQEVLDLDRINILTA